MEKTEPGVKLDVADVPLKVSERDQLKVSLPSSSKPNQRCPIPLHSHPPSHNSLLHHQIHLLSSPPILFPGKSSGLGPFPIRYLIQLGSLYHHIIIYTEHLISFLDKNNM